MTCQLPQGRSSESSGMAGSMSVQQLRALLERLPPVTVCPVPLDGVGQALLERNLRLVAELAADLGDVDGIALVVAEPVGDLLDAVPPGAGGLEQLAGELLVRELGATADVVNLARAATGEHQVDAAAVVV